MRSFFLLTRVQVLSLVNSLAPVRSGLSHNQRTLRILLAVGGFALLGLIMMGYMGIMAAGLAAVGLARTLPLLAVAMGSLAGIVFTFIKANGVLFGFKDYDLVMSLPVSRRVVVASRMTTLLGAAAALGACLMLPFYVVYFLTVPPQGLSVAAAGASVVLAPLAPTAVATFAAYLVTWIASRFRHANLAYVALGILALLAFLGASLTFSAGAKGADSEVVLQTLGQIGALIEGSVATFYPPAAWAAAAVNDGSALALAGFAVFSLGVAGVCLELMQRRYTAINAALTARKRGARRARGANAANTGASVREQTPFWAIVRKELRTLIGIPTYAFNCLIGYVIIVAAAVFLAVVDLQAFVASGSINGVQIGAGQAAQLAGNIQLIVPWVFGFCGFMCCSPVCSASIEGRAFWLMATAPVSTRTMLGAKLASGAIPCGTSLALAATILVASGAAAPLVALECLLVGFGTFLLWVCTGMFIDVRHPNFTWMNPQDVVKRGAPMLICILGGLVYVFLLGGVIFGTSLTFGLATGHALSLIAGVVSIALGGLIFRSMVKATPSLHI